MRNSNDKQLFLIQSQEPDSQVHYQTNCMWLTVDFKWDTYGLGLRFKKIHCMAIIHSKIRFQKDVISG